MKSLFILVAFVTCLFTCGAQPFGIGTATPDNKAVMDIVSANKGVLIPRLDDTSNVANPAEGLMIFNKTTGTPFYYNGSRWLTMGNLPFSSATPADRITYTMGSNIGFYPFEYPVNTLTQEITNSVSGFLPGKPRYSDFSFTKPEDKNSPAFTRNAAVPALVTSIEFKVYAAGAASPYLSYRFRNIVIKSVKTNSAAVGDPYQESISFSFENYGIRDWVNNILFGYNVKTLQFTTY